MEDEGGPRAFDPYSCQLAPCAALGCMRVGNTARCGRCNIGPHWMCNAGAWAMILGITAAFNAFCGARLHYGVVVCNVASCLALAAAFGLTSFSDPGYLPRQTPAQLERQKAELAEGGTLPRVPLDGASVLMGDPMLEYTACSICHVMRGRGTQHCYDCGLCVRELDHHCPWSGKCIAQGNIIAFRWFLGTLLAHCIFTGVVSPERQHARGGGAPLHPPARALTQKKNTAPSSRRPFLCGSWSRAWPRRRAECTRSAWGA
jgi:hypothetical protein